MVVCRSRSWINRCYAFVQNHYCPGSGILATSVIGDSTIDTWFMNWLQAHINAMNKDQLENCTTIALSSGTAKNISSCIKLGAKNDMRALMIFLENRKQL